MSEDRPETVDEARGPGAGSADAAVPPAAEAVDHEVVRARAREADALEERLRRAQASFLNETRRIARQAEQDRRFAIEAVVLDLVPVLESLHQAGESLDDSEVARRMRDGLDLVGRQLHGILARHGVEPIEAEGRAFDPSRHDAELVVQREDLPPGHVAKVLRPGYTLHGRVVQPARVAVTPAAPPPPPEGADPGPTGGSE